MQLTRTYILIVINSAFSHFVHPIVSYGAAANSPDAVNTFYHPVAE